MLNQELNGSIFKEKGVQLIIKREDLLYPEIQGNKWRKLKYNLAFAADNKYECILSFGGAYSNHIAALAAAGKKYGLKTHGIIRGEEPASLNPTLALAQQNGMTLEFVSRQTYRTYTQEKNWTELKSKYQDFYFIPEGGTNELAIKGCTEILSEEEIESFDVFACPVGTGGTIAGIITRLQERKSLIGFPALKGNFLQKDIKALLTLAGGMPDTNYTLTGEYHFGGYAKPNATLISFIEDFYSQYQIPLDPIYTGKMMYGLMDMIQRDKFSPGTRIMAIHTGGLQGIEGFNARFGTTLRRT